jgi:hypothetical protein
MNGNRRVSLSVVGDSLTRGHSIEKTSNVRRHKLAAGNDDRNGVLDDPFLSLAATVVTYR